MLCLLAFNKDLVKECEMDGSLTFQAVVDSLNSATSSATDVKILSECFDIEDVDEDSQSDAFKLGQMLRNAAVTQSKKQKH